ncbi:unnamed protein product [Rhizophagus irregularis]|nr:unnamed protein product [Rhizophagus irregularis]
MKYYFLVLITLIALFALSLIEAAVIAIDYGTDWFKVALVKPGIPLDIVLNRDSKRKTQSALTIRGEERIMVQMPLILRNSCNAIFSCKEQAEAAAQEAIKDVVITVPSYYNQFERQAILDAAELAGLHVLSLINDVTAVGYDRSLGGQEFDIRLQRHFAEEFNKKFMPNTDAIASLENLHEEHDFRLPITRRDLENMTADLRKRVGGPIKAALDNAKLTLASIKSCVLVGGGVRVPSIQAELKEIVGEDKIAQNVNGDEAAVLGAAFRGAGLSRQFKVKEIKVKDITPYPIEVNHSSEPKESEDDEVTKDFGPTNIAITKITGLTAAIKQFNDVGVERPKVKVTLQLSESGIVSATEAIATIEHQSFTDKFKSFFGVNGNKSEESIKEVHCQMLETTSSSVNASEPTLETNKTQANDTEPTQKQTKIETINLNLEVEYVGIKPLGKNEKDESIKRARNNLESFVYRVRDFLQNEVVLQVSTESQRAELSSKLSETSDWLYEEGEEAQTVEFKTRLNNLKLLEQPIAYRREERIKLPNAIFKIKAVINSTRDFVDEIKTNTTAENRYHTDEELDKLLSVCGKVEEWLNEKLELQGKTPPHVNPSLVTIDIDKKLNEIEREFLILVSKKPPRKPKIIAKTTDTKTTKVDEQSTSSEGSSTTEFVSQSTATPMAESKKPEQSTTTKTKHEEL